MQTNELFHVHMLLITAKAGTETQRKIKQNFLILTVMYDSHFYSKLFL